MSLSVEFKNTGQNIHKENTMSLSVEFKNTRQNIHKENTMSLSAEFNCVAEAIILNKIFKKKHMACTRRNKNIWRAPVEIKTYGVHL
jgi:hypothetical protein